MALGFFPVLTYDKLKDVEEGADNHDQYLVTDTLIYCPTDHPTGSYH